MPRRTKTKDGEVTKLQVPSHSLLHERPHKISSTPLTTEKSCIDGQTTSSAQYLRERTKLYPVTRSTPGYQVVLNNVERRRGREMRRTLRAAEAARKKQQYRNIALAALLVLALGLAFVSISRLQ